MTGPIDGILLAAGESRRMGFPKPLLVIDDETFIERITRRMLTLVPRLIIVLGAHADRIRRVIPDDPRITVVDNPDWPQGQLSSLKAGVAALRPEAGAAMIHLGDHPMVRAVTFSSLITRYQTCGKPIVVTRCGDRRGHPVIFARQIFGELMDAPLDKGARVVVRADSSRVEFLDTDDAGVVLDLDTPADLERAGLPPPPGHP